MTTAKHPQGAAYNGTGALKLSGDEPRRNFFRRMPKQEPEEKRTKAAPAAQKPPAAPAEERKGENLLMSFLGGWSIRGAFLAIAVIAAVIIGTLISNAQLVMVNDQMVELRSTLSDLQDQETQLKAQYELSYDLQDIERQLARQRRPRAGRPTPWSFQSRMRWSITRPGICPRSCCPWRKNSARRCGNISKDSIHKIMERKREGVREFLAPSYYQ